MTQRLPVRAASSSCPMDACDGHPVLPLCGPDNQPTPPTAQGEERSRVQPDDAAGRGPREIRSVVPRVLQGARSRVCCFDRAESSQEFSCLVPGKVWWRFRDDMSMVLSTLSSAQDGSHAADLEHVPMR